MTISPILSSEERSALSELRSRLEDLLGSRLKRLALFGSKARGDAEPDSDTDVAIIVEGLDRVLKRRILDIVTDVELKHLTVLSTLILSKADFDQLKARELRLADDIEREGVALQRRLSDSRIVRVVSKPRGPMNQENKRANIRDELARSREAKASAELLFEHGQVRDAVSRLYYSVFYAMRALLLTRALQPRSHEGVLNLFSLHFVRPGLFQSGDAHTFSRLQKYRQEADYASSYVFTASDYLEFSREAEQLLTKIETHIKTERYL